MNSIQITELIDVYIDEVHYLMEITLTNDNTGYITLTEACSDECDEDEICMHACYDFKEIL